MREGSKHEIDKIVLICKWENTTIVRVCNKILDKDYG